MGQVFAPRRNFHRPLLQLRKKGNQVGTGGLGQAFTPRYVSRKNRQQIIKKRTEVRFFLLWLFFMNFLCSRLFVIQALGAGGDGEAIFIFTHTPK